MSFESLPPEEQQRVAAQVEFFVTVMLKRYGMSESDLPALVDAVRYFRDHKEFVSKVKTSGTLSLIGLAMAAVASAVWQGIKTMLGGR